MQKLKISLYDVLDMFALDQARASNLKKLMETNKTVDSYNTYRRNGS